MRPAQKVWPQGLNLCESEALLERKHPHKFNPWGHTFRPVDATGPEGVAPGIELVRVLPLQEGLGLAVSDLLSPVRLHRWATMVPDDRRRAEADPVAPLEQAPADVHVVRRFLEDRVEPADFLQSALPERHVAARDVLGRSIVEHYLRRAARRSVDALRDPAVFRC